VTASAASDRAGTATGSDSHTVGDFQPAAAETITVPIVSAASAGEIVWSVRSSTQRFGAGARWPASEQPPHR
jgi:hypothetical protein